MPRRGLVTLTHELRRAAKSTWGAKILHFCPFVREYFNYAQAPNNPEGFQSDINAQWRWETAREISDLCRPPCCLMWPSHEYKFAAWQLDSFDRFLPGNAEQRRQNAGEIHPWMTCFLLFLKWPTGPGLAKFVALLDLGICAWMCSFVTTNEVPMISKWKRMRNSTWQRSGINEKSRGAFLKVTSITKMSGCPSRPLSLLRLFDALPGCDTGSHFAPADLKPCPKKKERKKPRLTGLPLCDFAPVTRIPLDNLTG